MLDPRDMDWIVQSADVLQIGARNMQNFPLLVEAGRTHKPVILKRGLSSTLAEWLASAEYIMNAGNPQVMLCERASAPLRPTPATPWTSAPLPP